MGSITATNSSTPSVQSLLLQSRIDQARREADQAEARARDLRAQADDEQRKADQGRGAVRQLSAQQVRVAPFAEGASSESDAPVADPTYASAVRAPAATVPAHVENPQSFQTVAMARSLSSLQPQAIWGAGANPSTRAGRLLSVTA